MNKTNHKQPTRNKVINIRLTSQEYAILTTKASAKGKNLSGYIRDKSMDDEDPLYDDMPYQIDTWNLVNEIYHEAIKCSDVRARDTILSIIRNYAIQQTEVSDERSRT